MEPAHLTYCSNVHPAESLAEVESALCHAARVKALVSPDAPFPLGLRVSARAAEELRDEAARERFADRLLAAQLYVTTLNGFPYGTFHGVRVKADVYRPDWQEAARVDYSFALCELLARLLPEGTTGSISSVPLCFKPRYSADAEPAIVEHLLAVALRLVEIHRSTGKTLLLALEPEPGCVLETAGETVSFFQQRLWHPATLARFAASAGLDRSGAEAALRRHLGACLDTCHAAVEFEAPLAVYERFRAAGIAVPKVQVSAGLRVPAPTPETLRELARFDEPTYLHQVVARTPRGLLRFDDLPEAFADAEACGAEEWRVHFHVPVFEAKLGSFGSTQPDTAELVRALGSAYPEPAPVLEVETYTWDVLPAELRQRPLVEAIAEELTWTRAVWAAGRAGA